MASTKRSLIKVLLFVHLVSLVSAGGLFGNDGAEVEGDSNRVQRPEDLLAESGKVWIVTVKGINEEVITMMVTCSIFQAAHRFIKRTFYFIIVFKFLEKSLVIPTSRNIIEWFGISHIYQRKERTR